VPAFPGIIQTSNTTITYNPPNRQTAPVTIPFLTTAGGITANSSITLSPSLTAADEIIAPYILACDTAGQLWQVHLGATTELPMQNYDGTIVSPFVNLIAMAMNINDNYLYYVLSTSPTIVRYYDWTSKVSGIFINNLAINISLLTYDNFRNILYATSSVDGQLILAFHVPGRTLVAPRFGAIVNITQPFTSIGCTKTSISAEDASGALSFAINPAGGANSQIIQTYPNSNSIGTPQAIVSAYYLTQVGSGFIVAYQAVNRRFYTSRDPTIYTLSFTAVNDYVSISRTPYGIIV
jgi:hypothetical protein